MRSSLFVVALVACLGLTRIASAQTAPRLTVHNVTLHQGAGVLTITGIGFGRQPTVTVDGQPATVLPGGTETQIDVLAPTALLTTPGTYRLTLVDPERQVGDAFVVASQAGSVAFAGATLHGPPSAPSAAMTGPAPAEGLVPPPSHKPSAGRRR